MLRYRVIHTSLGYWAIILSESGLRNVRLPVRTRAEALAAVRAAAPEAVADERCTGALADELTRYSDGEPVEFSVACDWSGFGQFEQDVWRACRKVGHGSTISYGELARRAGSPGAARAVGRAMGRNPCPVVVPCHRVTRSDGSLGGYSGPSGVAFKQRLLELESAWHVEPA